MKVLVCIKQVPGSTNVEVDPVTGVLKRDGIQSKMNPYDLYAIETALNLTEKFGGSVEVITMGPPQAKTVITEAICMGAKQGTVLSDRRFAGADGDTAQVGAEVAEFLGLPNVANVLSVKDICDNKIVVTASQDDKIVDMSIKLPCIISVDGDINTPRLPSYKVKKCVTDDMIKFLSLDDFDDKNVDNYGLSGSATQVERIFPPEKNKEKRSIEGTPQQQADELYSLIRRIKLV